MTLPQVLDLISKVGLVGLLVAILYGSYKRVWVWGTELKKVESERDEWKRAAMTGISAADTVTEYAVRQRLSHDAAQDRRARLAEVLNEPPPPHGVRRKVRP